MMHLWATDHSIEFDRIPTGLAKDAQSYVVTAEARDR
jgi:hypothetical protein